MIEKPGGRICGSRALAMATCKNRDLGMIFDECGALTDYARACALEGAGGIPKQGDPVRRDRFGHRLRNADGQSRHSAPRRPDPRDKPLASPRLVTCSLEDGNRKRTIMAPGNYTELFFMDEATSFAAGPRPCAECRRADYSRFRAAWAEGLGLGQLPSAIAIDTLLHARRIQRGRVQVVHSARASTLPDGAMFSESDAAFLVWKGKGLRWSFAGYSIGRTLNDRDVTVITPAPTVAALHGGYRPEVHPSAI